MEITSKNVFLNCRRCPTSFKAAMDILLDHMDQAKETGLCPMCVMKCEMCESPYDSTNVNKLCFSCHTLCEDNEDSDSQSSGSGSINYHNFGVDQMVDEVISNIEASKIDESSPSAAELSEEAPYVDSSVITVDYILIPDDVVDLTHEDNNERKICHKIVNAYKKSGGNLGSDGNGGSINGEMSPAGCLALGTALQLNSADYICDLGSGSGKSLMLMAAMFKVKAAVGIENQAMRHVQAMNCNKYLLTNVKDIEVPITFLHEDIHKFSDLNGVSKVYIYDPAFDVELLNKVTEILNSTTSIQYIVTTQRDLVKYGFNGELLQNVGCLKACGGSMSHTFYVYKTHHFNEDCTVWNPVIKAAFENACSRNARQATAVDYMKSFHGSKTSPRSQVVQQILGEQNKNVKSCEVLHDLLAGVKLNEEIAINTTAFKLTSMTKTYSRFNEQLLYGNKIQMDAVVHSKNRMALIAPSYDGKGDGNGTILVGIVYDPSVNQGSYYGFLYPLEHKKLVRVAIMGLFQTYDHNNSFPCDITSIVDKFRKDFPLAPLSTSQNNDGSRSSAKSRPVQYTPEQILKRPRISATELKAQAQEKAAAKLENEAAKKLKKEHDELQKKVKEQEVSIKAQAQQIKKAEAEKRKSEAEANKFKAAAQLIEQNKRQRLNAEEQPIAGSVRISNVAELSNSIVTQLRESVIAPRNESTEELKIDNAVNKKVVELLMAQREEDKAERKYVDDLRTADSERAYKLMESLAKR